MNVVWNWHFHLISLVIYRLITLRPTSSYRICFSHYFSLTDGDESSTVLASDTYYLLSKTGIADPLLLTRFSSLRSSTFTLAPYDDLIMFRYIIGDS